MNFLDRNWDKYWKERQDWTGYTSKEAIMHPHRRMLLDILSKFPWFSLIEIGCGGGANLVNIVKTFPGRQIGGVDISPKAIEQCEKMFNGGIFKVNSADDVMMSNKSTDVTLTDAMLIYVGKKDIKRHLLEIKRITRNYVVLCEFHSTSFWERLKLKINSGYNAYDYVKLLTKLGFFDITLFKIPKELWEGPPWEKYGHIIVATVPKR